MPKSVLNTVVWKLFHVDRKLALPQVSHFLYT